MTAPFDPELAQQILDCLTKYPGLHLSKIAEVLELKISVVEWYLVTLMEQEQIYSTKEEGFIRYFVKERSEDLIEDRRTHTTRQQLMTLITQNPGLHQSKIGQMLNMSKQLAEYHLNYLEKNGLIRSVKEDGGHYKRFYITADDVGLRERRIIELLRQPPLFRIVSALLKHSQMIHKDLSKQLDIPLSTLSYHLKKLSDEGVVQVVPYGKEHGYSLVNQKEILHIIRKYNIDRTFDNIHELWKDFDIFS
jgi:predicted transcriptional regulator